MRSAPTEAVEILYAIRNIDYNTINQNDNKYYIGTYSYYRYFSKSELEDKLDIKNPTQSVIINFKTREVISVEGEVHDGIEYHRLEDMHVKNS